MIIAGGVRVVEFKRFLRVCPHCARASRSASREARANGRCASGWRRATVGGLLAAMLASTGTSAAFGDDTGNGVSVEIGIAVGAIVEIEFPEGTAFDLQVSEIEAETTIYRGPGAEIPCVVRTNVPTRLTLTPASVIVLDDLGAFGVAHADGATQSDRSNWIAYRTVIRAAARHRDLGPNCNSQTGEDGGLHAEIGAGRVRGVIEIAPVRLDPNATPGRYSGALSIVVGTDP